MPLRPRQFNFLAAFEAEHGQPAYVSRPTLLEFVEKHKGAKGPLGHTIRWPAWLTYNQSTDRPFKSLRRGQFLMAPAWTEYNAWKGKSNSSTPIDTPATGSKEVLNHNPDSDES